MNKVGYSSPMGGVYRSTEEEKREMEANYPKGAAVKLVKMDNEPGMKIGLKGKVLYIDDALSIHVRWENGSSLAILHDEDKCELI